MIQDELAPSLFEFLKGRKVLITGNTGFKGSWLSELVLSQGGLVVGLSIDIPTTPSLFESLGHKNDMVTHWGDVSDSEFVSKVISKEQPDFIFHLAAQPIVGISFSNPLETWRSNALGTATVLDSVARHGKKGTVVVCITSDKVYRNKEWYWGYREVDELGGTDPYSASKAAASLAIRSFVESQLGSANQVRVAEVRAGNVIGGGDWAVGRIVPDAIRAWLKGETLTIRNPKSTRPWQHVLEPLVGYLIVAKALMRLDVQSGETFNFGPLEHSQTPVESLISRLKSHLDRSRELHLKVEQFDGLESKLLKLDISKATSTLGWAPRLSVEESIDWTSDWYLSLHEGSNLKEITRQQVTNYVSRFRLDSHY